MKAIQISRTGGPEVLDCVDLAMPKPAPGEVLVRAHAIGVSYFDMLIRTGRYRWMPPLPFVLGNDLSGRVVATNGGKLKADQPVFVAGWDIGFRGGLYAEYAAVPETAIWPLPDEVDLDEAAALANYALAWILLHRAARGVEPRTVLIYGAAGGVGTALLDAARLAGSGRRYSAALRSGALPERNCSSNAASSALATLRWRSLTWPKPRIFSGMAARPTASG